MSISIDEVKRVAALARLSLSPEEEQKYTEQLSAILDYVAKLQELDLESAENVAEMDGHTIAELRPDSKDKGRYQEEILKLSPTKRDNYFAVPAVFGEE